MSNDAQKFFTSRDKTLFKLLFLVFLFFVFVFNWSSLSWFVNIRTAPALIQQTFSDVSDRVIETISSLSIFEGKNDNDYSLVDNNNHINDNDNDNNNEEDEDKDVEVEPTIDPALYCEENSITIETLDVSVPLVEAGGVTEQEYRDTLDRGVMHFPGSSFPGETGLSVLLGHSAPRGRPRVKHDWVFTHIDELKEGDTVEICYDNRKWTYTIVDEEVGQKVYEVGEDVPLLYPEENKKELVLMTCWPPGDNTSRIGVRGVIEE